MPVNNKTANSKMPDCEQLRLDKQLCFPLYVCSKEVIRRYKPFLDEIGLTYTQYLVMLVLWEAGDHTVKELGTRLYLDSGTLTPLLKKMEQTGLVNRERDEMDIRSVIVSLTAKGRELREKAAEIPAKIGTCVGITEQEAQELYRLLYRVMDSLQ